LETELRTASHVQAAERNTWIDAQEHGRRTRSREHFLEPAPLEYRIENNGRRSVATNEREKLLRFRDTADHDMPRWHAGRRTVLPFALTTDLRANSESKELLNEGGLRIGFQGVEESGLDWKQITIARGGFTKESLAV